MCLLTESRTNEELDEAGCRRVASRRSVVMAVNREPWAALDKAWLKVWCRFPQEHTASHCGMIHPRKPPLFLKDLVQLQNRLHWDATVLRAIWCREACLECSFVMGQPKIPVDLRQHYLIASGLQWNHLRIYSCWRIFWVLNVAPNQARPVNVKASTT